MAQGHRPRTAKYLGAIMLNAHGPPLCRGAEDYSNVNNFPHWSTRHLQQALADHDIICEHSTPNTRLQYLISRVERGLPIYDICSDTELLHFARAKKLEYTEHSRSTLISLLEHSDEHSPFLSLPISICTRIYAFHFASLPPTFSAPPITCVNQQIRRESLRQFYSTHHFRLPLCQTLTGELLLKSPSDQAFFERAPKKYFAMIRHLHVPISLRSRSMRLQVDCSEWEIDFDKATVRRIGTSADDEREYTTTPEAIERNLGARVKMLALTQKKRNSRSSSMAEEFASFFRARGNKIRDW